MPRRISGPFRLPRGRDALTLTMNENMIDCHPIEGNNIPMKLLTPLLLASVILGPFPAWSRPFTNTEGKTIEAEIVRATSTEVTLRLQNRRIATVGIASLQEADQAFVRRWLSDQVPPLRITPNMVRKTTKDSRSSYSRSRSYRQSFELSVDFTNDDNAKGLEESTLKYFLVGRSLGKTKSYKILRAEEKDFQIVPGGRETVTFPKTEHRYYDGSSSYYSYYGNYKCIGYVLYASRKKDDREVYTYASTPQLEEALYSIVTLRQRDVVDENFQKARSRRSATGERAGRMNEDRDDGPDRPSRRSDPSPPAKPTPPIIIR